MGVNYTRGSASRQAVRGNARRDAKWSDLRFLPDTPESGSGFSDGGILRHLLVLRLGMRPHSVSLAPECLRRNRGETLNAACDVAAVTLARWVAHCC